ncbi:hypothetical protein CVT26_012205 [Gymnopilus dilepis]|uniref:Uncharacterized protein n=1 Tax=Gymnopilus dilepis TaxID=231916 RepID=A0A409YC76_9AGAR|nr:hypothetical protein CVT26_012205 [Gymnopilus dilepis]
MPCGLTLLISRLPIDRVSSISGRGGTSQLLRVVDVEEASSKMIKVVSSFLVDNAYVHCNLAWLGRSRTAASRWLVSFAGSAVAEAPSMCESLIGVLRRCWHVYMRRSWYRSYCAPEVSSVGEAGIGICLDVCFGDC